MGAGGLGCPVGVYLAAAGVGRIGIVDYDTVEVSNLHRQVAHFEEREGTAKVESLKATMRAINGKVRIDNYHVQVSSENALDMIKEYAVVVDATDNITTRYLLNDACVLLGKVLVSGAALKWDGQLTTYHHGEDGPCYRCLHPTPPPTESLQSCDMNGVAGPIPGVIGTLQALEVIRLIALNKPNYSKKMLLYSGETGLTRVVALRPRRRDCAVCGTFPTITSLIDYVAFCGAEAAEGKMFYSFIPEECRMSVEAFETLIKGPNPIQVVDVRPAEYARIAPLRTIPSLNIPMDELENRWQEIPDKEGTTIVFVCRRGIDSQHAVQFMMTRNTHSQDVVGGLQAYARSIDPTMPLI